MQNHFPAGSCSSSSSSIRSLRNVINTLFASFKMFVICGSLHYLPCTYQARICLCIATISVLHRMVFIINNFSLLSWYTNGYFGLVIISDERVFFHISSFIRLLIQFIITILPKQ
uniref:Uncharacterized protein n=1 Tax=Opuntia streptacantha TaxID=393608 RepID=A0A7C9D9N3_OPUST